MPPALPTRLAALERDVQAFHARLHAVVASAPAEGLTPGSPQVQRAFSTAAHLAGRGASIAQARSGWDQLDEPLLDRARPLLISAMNAARTAAQLLGTGPLDRAEATASTTDPRSARSASTWLAATQGRDLPNVRIVGSIPPPAANLVADRLENTPGRVVKQLDAQGRRATLFSGSLTDVHGFRHLRGVRPRGWPEGSTWDAVPGAGGPKGLATNPSRELPGRGHGSSSLALHELGHVVDWTMARPTESRVTDGDRWRRGPQREARAAAALSSYLTDHPEEWYAESFARYTRSPQSHASLARWYPETYRFLERTLGEPRFD
jgi:hypothetical protein